MKLKRKDIIGKPYHLRLSKVFLRPVNETGLKIFEESFNPIDRDFVFYKVQYFLRGDPGEVNPPNPDTTIDDCLFPYTVYYFSNLSGFDSYCPADSTLISFNRKIDTSNISLPFGTNEFNNKVIDPEYGLYYFTGCNDFVFFPAGVLIKANTTFHLYFFNQENASWGVVNPIKLAPEIIFSGILL